MATAVDETFLKVELKNSRPVELVDLTASLMALGQFYEEFATDHGYDPIPGNVRLYIKELRSGSVIAELVAALDQASFILEHADLYAGFLTNFNDLVQFFLNGGSRGEENRPSKTEVEHLSQIFEPVAKDGGSQLILVVQRGDVHINQYTYNSQEANTVQNRARKFLGPSLPGVQYFQHEPMSLYQVRDDTKGKAGDRGIIQKFSPKPIRLHFMNEESKKRVLDYPASPLRQIFFVDGEVGMSGDKPALYKIQHVHDWEDTP